MSPALHYIQTWLAKEIWDCPADFWGEINLEYTEQSDNLYIPKVVCLDNLTGFDTVNKTGVYEEWLCPFWKGENPKSILPFDVFAACFFLLSRYEEYQNFKPDTHGRFPLKETWAYKHNLYEYPIVQIWVEMLRKALIKHFPKLENKLKAPRPLQTKYGYDIDLAFAYLNKAHWRQAAAMGRHFLLGQWNLLSEQISVLLGKKKDPFYTFDIIEQWHKQRDEQAHFFWLLADYGHYDKNISWKNQELRNIIKNTDKWAVQGVHPSYVSNSKISKLEEEAQRLEEILGRKTNISRQHYLKLSFPDTYNNLIKIGITEEHSLGFAEAPGYRAGTNFPFPWFNIKENKQTELIIQPFIYMDASLKYYLKYIPEEALQKIKELQEKAQNYGCPWYSLWHNNTLADKEWQKVWQKSFLDKP